MHGDTPSIPGGVAVAAILVLLLEGIRHAGRVRDRDRQRKGAARHRRQHRTACRPGRRRQLRTPVPTRAPAKQHCLADTEFVRVARQAQFLAFTHDAFGRMRTAGTKTLIIDVRANGGGNDEMWIEGVLPYLATKPYRWASRYRKRVVVADPARHEAVGDIVDGEVETWIPPRPGNPLRFRGQGLRAGGHRHLFLGGGLQQRHTGFRFRHDRGLGPQRARRTTGGTRRTTLPNSGLIVVAPRFVLTRPSGAKTPALLTPDLEVRDLRNCWRLSRRTKPMAGLVLVYLRCHHVAATHRVAANPHDFDVAMTVTETASRSSACNQEYRAPGPPTVSSSSSFLKNRSSSIKRGEPSGPPLLTPSRREPASGCTRSRRDRAVLPSPRRCPCTRPAFRR